MNELGFNNEYEELKRKFNILKSQVSDKIELHQYLVENVGPDLKARYMVGIGQYEHRIFELMNDINRWKRRFVLRQQALNRGGIPDYADIEIKLDQEFAEYIAEVNRHLEDLKAAAFFCNADRLSEKDATAMRYAYLNAVKKLHPDINPKLPDSAAKLWNKIQQAYHDKDWAQMRVLTSLVDTVVTGADEFDCSLDGIEALKAACRHLEEQCENLADRTARLRSQPPFTYEEQLEDEKWVMERQSLLQEKIAILENKIKEYEEHWNYVKRNSAD